jgi:hypothetical protein
MEPIYNSLIPLKGFEAMNIAGFIFARKEYRPLSEKTIRHEKIHGRQTFEMIIVFFWLWYGIEWIVRWVQYRDADKAYRNISFEREAFKNEKNENYLNERKPFGWIKYLKL